MSNPIVYVMVGTVVQANELARVLELPRRSVLSYRQAPTGLRGRSELAVAVPPFGRRLIDLEPRALFAALKTIDMHNAIMKATHAAADDRRRMDAVHRSRAARHTRKEARA